MEEILKLIYEVARNAPEILALITLLALIGSAVVLGDNSRRSRKIRKYFSSIEGRLRKSRGILRDIEESEEVTDERIKDAKQGLSEAISLIRIIQKRDDTEDSPSDDS